MMSPELHHLPRPEDGHDGVTAQQLEDGVPSGFPENHRREDTMKTRFLSLNFHGCLVVCRLQRTSYLETSDDTVPLTHQADARARKPPRAVRCQLIPGTSYLILYGVWVGLAG
jgi:hypothetical protein